MKNSADQGGCYPPTPKAKVDSTLRVLQNFSYSKYFQTLKVEKELFVLLLTKINTTSAKVFSVNGSIIHSGLYF